MKTGERRLTIQLPLALLLTSTITRTAGAHEKWFYSGEPPGTRFQDVFQWPVLCGVGIVLAITGIIYVLWRLWGRRDIIPGPKEFGATDDRRTDFYAFVPAILAMHLAICCRS